MTRACTIAMVLAACTEPGARPVPAPTVSSAAAQRPTIEIAFALRASDREGLRCALAQTIEGNRCAALRTGQPTSEAIAAEALLQPFSEHAPSSSRRRVFLLSGMWLDAEVKRQAAASPGRFVVRCAVTTLGSAPDVALQWEPLGEWKTPTDWGYDPDVLVGTVSRCVPAS